MTDLMKRLNGAMAVIDKAIKADDPALVGKMAKRLQPLHAECYVIHVDSDSDNCKEYHYAEFLKLSIMFYFESMFDYGGECFDLYEQMQVEAWKAGIIPNKITGKMIE